MRQQQELLRHIRPEFGQNTSQIMRNMQNGGLLSMKQNNNLSRTAMANSQNMYVLDLIAAFLMCLTAANILGFLPHQL